MALFFSSSFRRIPFRFCPSAAYPHLSFCFSTCSPPPPPPAPASASTLPPSPSSFPPPIVIHQTKPHHHERTVTKISFSPSSPSGPLPQISAQKISEKHGWRRINIQERIITIFFPKDYPHSVAKNYFSYSSYHFIHLLAGSVTGVLSMQSLLYAIGLGAGSIPLAAALNWVIKDGLGQLGGVLYAGLMGNRFDSDPKRHRLMAGFSLQAATLLEIITPLFPAYFLLLASVSNVGKNISWLATSATRAQIHKTLSSKENLGEVTGKAGSQSTAAGLLGTGLGVLVSAYTGSDFLSVFFTYLPFSAISLTALYISNTKIVIKTLNDQRLDLILQHFSKLEARFGGNLMDALLKVKPEDLQRSLLPPSPEEISAHESFLFSFRPLLLGKISIDPPFDSFSSSLSPAETLSLTLRASSAKHGYLLSPGPPSSTSPTVALWFLQHAKNTDVVRGLLHATLLQGQLERKGGEGRGGLDALQTPERLFEKADEVVEHVFPAFYHGLREQGWHLEHLFLAEEHSRIRIERQ